MEIRPTFNLQNTFGTECGVIIRNGKSVFGITS